MNVVRLASIVLMTIIQTGFVYAQCGTNTSGACTISASPGPSIFFGQSITFSATSCGVTYSSYDWSDSFGNGGLGQSVTFNYPNPGTYCVTLLAECSDGGLFNGETCTPGTQKYTHLQINVFSIPPDPDATFSIVPDCGSTTIILSSGIPGGSLYSWYWQTTASGTSTALGSSAIITLPSSTNLYLRSRLNISPFTWSTGSQFIGFINVDPTPKPGNPLNPQNSFRFGTGSMTFAATPGSNSDNLRWYNTSLNTNPQFDGLSKTETIVAPGSKTYYVRSLNTAKNCVSAGSTPITATAYAMPVITATPPSLSGSSTVTLDVGIGYDSYSWTNALGQVVSTTKSYITSTPGTFTVLVSKSGASTSTNYSVTCGVNDSGGCNISNNFQTSFCLGDNIVFSTACTKAEIFDWSSSDGQSAIGQTFNPTFSSAGTYCITLNAECPDNGNCQPVGLWKTHLTITVEQPLPAPIATVSQTSMCQNSNVTLNVVNPQAGQQYSWFKQTTASNDFIYIGTGNTLNYFVTEHSAFQARYGTDTSQPMCGTTVSSSLLVSNFKNEQTPVELVRTYRKSVLRGMPQNEVGHFWQTSASGNSTSPENSTVKDLTVYADGSYYINMYNPSGSCWGNASAINLTLDYQPPLAVLSEAKKPGYNQVYLINVDKPFLIQFADYYWVNGLTGTNTDKKFVDGNKIYSSGTYFVRGRDKITQTWGQTLSINIQLRDDNSFLNWIQTTSFDGSALQQIVFDSKQYFDNSGQLFQSQTRNLSAGLVLASQPIKDQYDRNVGSSLPAPRSITSGQFGFQAAFLLTQDGNPFNYQDFGFNDVFDETIPGSLGWYYSSNNTLEPLTPKTKFPYARNSFYNDGTAEVKMASAAGEALRIGAGHELLNGTFPVHNELSDYLAGRPSAIPGITAPAPSLSHEAAQSVSRDQNGKYVVSITDKSGNAVMAARMGTAADYILQVNNTIVASADPASANYNPMVYLYLFESQPVSITGTGSFVVDDIVNDVTIAPSGTWPAGFYRIRILSGVKTIAYTNRYADVSYNYYDDANRLVTSISPNGFSQLKNAVPYANVDHTTYQYNHQGWLLSITETDAGTTQYAYRKDGSIRFSQNAEQALTGRYSYTNYDLSGRPLESGEYIAPPGLLFSQVRNNATILEVVGDAWMTGIPSLTRKDWVKTHYDNASSDMETLLPSHRQDFVMSSVSWTENANIKTWYSYDDLGRVQWMAQQPNQLSGLVFLTEYTYDFLGNVLTVGNKTLQSGTTTVVNQFYHYYVYDADKRLAEVRTSPDGLTQVLQAKYFYYLHGPLKRIELADKLQGIDFVYTINGWLKSINDPSSDPGGDGITGQNASYRKDVFGIVLDYYETALTGVFKLMSSSIQQNPDYFHKIPHAEMVKYSMSWRMEDEVYRDQLKNGLKDLRLRLNNENHKSQN